MDTLEPDAQSFIVKVWVEDGNEKVGNSVWRGHITHVSSGSRHYIKNMDEISEFIAPYLQEMGVKSGMRWRISSWLKRLMARS
jgi:hypothetical protein